MLRECIFGAFLMLFGLSLGLNGFLVGKLHVQQEAINKLYSALVEQKQKTNYERNMKKLVVANYNRAKKKLRYLKSRKNQLAIHLQTVYRIKQNTAKELAGYFAEAERRFDIDAVTLIAQAKAESDFRPKAVSKYGARGLLQIMPFWAKEIEFVESPEDLYDVRTNILAAGYILSYYERRCRNAVACYHAGENPRNHGPRTAAYVKKVSAYRNKLINRIGV